MGLIYACPNWKWSTTGSLPETLLGCLGAKSLPQSLALTPWLVTAPRRLVSQNRSSCSLRASKKTESPSLHLWLVLHMWSWAIAINLNSISAQHRWPWSIHLPACVFLSDHRFQLTEALTSPLDLGLALPLGAMVTVCLLFPLTIWGPSTTF